MGPVKKSTKKFLKNKLSSVLKKRKESRGNKPQRKQPATPKEEPGPDASSSDDDQEQGLGFDDVEQDVKVSDSELSDQEGEEMDLQDQDFSSEEEDDEVYAQQLASLAEKDPKFFQYLKDNDENLLEFTPIEKPKSKAAKTDVDGDEDSDIDTSNVTVEMVQEWTEGLQKNSLKALKEMLLALKAVAAINDSEEKLDLVYSVEPGKASNMILITALKFAPIIFNHVAYGAEANTDKARPLPSATKKWKKIQALVKSFLSTLINLMTQQTDETMVKFVLKASEDSVAYFASFPKLAKEYIKMLLKLWSTSSVHQTQILSFLCLRKLAMAAPNPYLDQILKGTYASLSKCAKVTNAHTFTHIAFLTNCIVEIGGLNLASTYQHMFVALRQLAMTIRACNTSRTKESFKPVYTWPFLHSLRLWGKMLNYVESDETLKPLVYPFVQICIGVIRLKPSAKYFPFRLHIIKLLLDVTKHTKVYIPLSSYLFEVFHPNLDFREFGT
jgi:nucleolar complex protein 2